MILFFYLLIAIMPLVRHSLWNETLLAGITLNKYVGIVCFLLALVHYAERRPAAGMLATVQSKLFVLFGIAMSISFTLYGYAVPGDGLGISPLANWVSLILLLFIATTLIDSLERLRYALLSLVAGVAFASAHSIREWIGAGMAFDYRPGWVTGDPNYFALSALLALPLAAVLALELETAWHRRFCMLCFGLILFAFMHARSRGAFLGLLASLLVMVWHSGRRLRSLTVGGGLLGTLLLIMPNSPIGRFLNPDSGDQSSNAAREALFWAGLAMFKDNLGAGVGVGNFKPLIRSYGGPAEDLLNVAHNTYIEVGAELGVLGLLLLVGTLVFSLLTLRRIRRQTSPGNPREKLIHISARGLEASLVGGIVAVFFLSAAHVRLLWFLVILSICLPPLARRAQTQPPAPPAQRRPSVAAAHS